MKIVFLPLELQRILPTQAAKLRPILQKHCYGNLGNGHHTKILQKTTQMMVLNQQNKTSYFFAFARHLKDKKYPIYDKHAIRALWAICGKLTANEKKKCKTLLFDGNGKWKQVGSGSGTIECYEIFVRHINDIVPLDNSITKSEIDRLLMPLGQAIKKSTGSYAEFHKLCGWPIGG